MIVLAINKLAVTNVNEQVVNFEKVGSDKWFWSVGYDKRMFELFVFESDCFSKSGQANKSQHLKAVSSWWAIPVTACDHFSRSLDDDGRGGQSKGRIVPYNRPVMGVLLVLKCFLGWITQDGEVNKSKLKHKQDATLTFCLVSLCQSSTVLEAISYSHCIRLWLSISTIRHEPICPKRN